MASIKDLKKDINFLTDEVIGTCFLNQYIHRNNPEKKEEIEKVINDMVDLRNDIVYKANHPTQVADGKKMKVYFRELYDEMLEKVDQAFEKLSSLNA